MNRHATANEDMSTNFDVLILGSGVSGINAAFRVQESLPDSSYAILEARHELGGTWSQFKYPGVRSDSDLHTLGFAFFPWKAKNHIASGGSILRYLNDTIDTFDIRKKIKYRHKVVGADWRSDQQRWKLDVEISSNDDEGTRRVMFWTKWLIMGTGYYSYEEPMKALVPGLSNFKGTTVHPQFWPEDLDCKNKKMVIIGSGATAITLLPALVDAGVGSVTQLQRSPSYIMSLPNEHDSWWESYVPEWFVLRYKRFMFALTGFVLYYLCIKFPTRASNILRNEAKRQLPADFPVDPHFKPDYNPWQQRLCLCPDGDYFKCFASGRAHVVTDTIKNVVSDGVELTSGKKLDADIIVTATGLNLRILGGVELSVDGQKVDIPSQYLWRFGMLTSLPNLGYIIGYWNASWTLGSDNSSRLFVRLIKHQIENKYTSVVPVITEADRKVEVLASPLSSTYVKNGLSGMPKCGQRGPWRPRGNYFTDRWGVQRGDLNDGLKWESVST